MAEPIDVFWSFRSPYSYLITPDLLKLKEEYDVQLHLRVVLPIAVRSKETLFQTTDGQKVQYIILDSIRRAQFLGLPIAMPRPDPIVQDMQTFEVADEQPYIFWLCKLGVEAARQGKGIEFAANISRLIFGGTENWDQEEHMRQAAAAAGLDFSAMQAAIEGADHLAEVESNQKELEQAGHWGVPTMVVRGEPFFGQDRVETLRWRLDQYQLQKP